MPVLSRRQLIDRLRTNGDLVVSPILAEDQIGAASIDLRMGTVILMVRARGSSHVDPATFWASEIAGTPHDLEVDKRQKHERYELPFGTRFLLHPGTLALVPTLEWVKVPLSLHGYVTARSTWAREGLNIATAAFIEPGYQGIITLELANLGHIPIALYAGLRIAQIAFSTVEGDATRPAGGQFQLAFEPTQGQVAKKDEGPFLPKL